MTTYHGGKKRIGLDIANIIVELYNDLPLKKRKKINKYCEPFCGMLGVFSHMITKLTSLENDGIDDLTKLTDFKFYGGDTNGSVIKMWNKLKKKYWSPPSECSKELFEYLKHNGKESSEKGFIGFLWAYRSKYFISYFSNPGEGRINKNRDDVKHIGKILRNNKDNIKFTKGDYKQFSKFKNAIIYCDPPYSSSNQYYNDDRTQIPFDNTEFWEWARNMSKNNLVIVSEYTAPNDFKQVWSKGDEKLFIYL
jgi:site-specific DNA-adenine methylase